MSKILNVITTPSENKAFPPENFVQDEGMINQCHVERRSENAEFFRTKSQHQLPNFTLKKNVTAKAACKTW